MATYIETLKKQNGDHIAPRTVAEAVSMNDGSNLEEKLSNIDSTVQENSTAISTHNSSADAHADKNWVSAAPIEIQRNTYKHIITYTNSLNQTSVTFTAISDSDAPILSGSEFETMIPNITSYEGDASTGAGSGGGIAGDIKFNDEYMSIPFYTYWGAVDGYGNPEYFDYYYESGSSDQEINYTDTVSLGNSTIEIDYQLLSPDGTEILPKTVVDKVDVNGQPLTEVLENVQNELNVAVERMLEVDKRGLESGDYNKEQYDTFRQKFPNRVYLEKYNKYSDGSEVERIYNKVALTAYPDPPEDFDEGDKGYMLESVPTRCGGGFPDSATAYQKGHIRVPALSVGDFPTNEDAQSFATPKKYVDTAIIKAFDKKDFQKINRYANTIDDKCIGVTATNGVSSGLQIYDNDGKSKYAVFKCSLWRDNSSSGGDASLELHLTDSSGIAFCYAIIFPYNTQQSYLSRPGGKRVDFDAKVHLPYGKWSEVYLEYDANACARLYIDDELVAETTDINPTNRPINVQVVSSRALQGHIALTNISFLTADIPTELTDAYRFYYDNSSDWFTTSATTGKRIARYGSDTWEIQSVEDFTGDDGYVLVNKKYLRKMLEGVGTGGNSVKMYNHAITIDTSVESTMMGTLSFSFQSPDPTPINTFDLLYANADKVPAAVVGKCANMGTIDYPHMDFLSHCKIHHFEFTKAWGTEYYLVVHYNKWMAMNEEGTFNYHLYDGQEGGSGPSSISDEVTEVGGGKVYLHILNMDCWAEATHNANATVAFYSTSADKIDSAQKCEANAELIEGGHILDGYVNNGNYDNEYIPYRLINIDERGIGFKYYIDFATNLSTIYHASYCGYQGDVARFDDTVTEV